MSTTDDWLYSDDLDVGVSERDRHMGSPDSRVLDGEDLLDDVLTAPSNHRGKSQTPTNDDELLGVHVKHELSMEDSGSARFNREQLARTVQARIEANKTSHGALNTGGTTVYSREPNRKNAFFIGNLTWWTTDLDIMAAVREVGLGEVLCIKFYENRANGQSKGYALVEVTSEALAMNAGSKLEEVTIHNMKPLVMYALKISPHQFESKCGTAKPGSTTSNNTNTSTGGGSTSRNHSSRPPTSASLPIAPPIHPPGMPPGFPPIPPGLHGFRPPGFPGVDSNGGLGIMGAAPHGIPGLPPGLPPPFNMLGRPGMPGMGMPPLPPGALGGALEQIKAAGNAPHLNPAFLQEMAAQNAQLGQGNMHKMAELFDRFRQQASSSSRLPGGHDNGGKHQASDEEAADANQRNRAISSSAINRALADANAGDYDGAVDMLRMAVTLIKQSVTSGTETSQILIQSLQDCLHGIEEQMSMSKRSSGRREHRSHEDRDRGRSSHRSSKHHRDRSRERRR